MKEDEIKSILPEDLDDVDEKNPFYIEEKKKVSKDEKKRLKKQKEFEFKEIELKSKIGEEEKKDALKDIVIRWTIVVATTLYLIILYFWLL